MAAVAVPGRIEIGPGVGDHLDPSHGELGALRVDRVRVLEGVVVGDLRSGQSGVGHHAGGDGVAEVDQAHGTVVPAAVVVEVGSVS